MGKAQKQAVRESRNTAVAIAGTSNGNSWGASHRYSPYPASGPAPIGGPCLGLDIGGSIPGGLGSDAGISGGFGEGLGTLGIGDEPTVAAAAALSELFGDQASQQVIAIAQALSQAGLLNSGLACPPIKQPINHFAVDQRNLYVSNLPVDADDLYLYKAFAYHGAIENAHAMTSENGCTGTGFVKFRHSHEAQEAVQALNGMQLPDGNLLYVSVKTPGRKASQTMFGLTA